MRACRRLARGAVSGTSAVGPRPRTSSARDPRSTSQRRPASSTSKRATTRTSGAAVRGPAQARVCRPRGRGVGLNPSEPSFAP